MGAYRLHDIDGEKHARSDLDSRSLNPFARPYGCSARAARRRPAESACMRNWRAIQCTCSATDEFGSQLFAPSANRFRYLLCMTRHMVVTDSNSCIDACSGSRVEVMMTSTSRLMFSGSFNCISQKPDDNCEYTHGTSLPGSDPSAASWKHAEIDLMMHGSFQLSPLATVQD